jgi:hypothetical protein
MLSVFLLAKTVYEFKASSLLGNDTPAVNTISVSGKGEVVAIPDIAKFSFSVIESAKTVPEAQKLATEKANKAVDAIKEKGVAEKDIKTTDFNVNPKYEYQRVACTEYYCPPGKQVLLGYEVTISYSIKVRKTDTAGEVLSSIGSLGVSNISGLNFTVDDQDKIVAEARGKAIADAKAKADVLADDLGVRIVRVVNFSENGGGYPVPMYARAEVSMAGSGKVDDSLQLPTGENTVTSNVSITYEIR